MSSFYDRCGSWRTPLLRQRGDDPFGVLVSTTLSHRARDEVTERATQALLSDYPTARALAGAPLSRIEALISEVGLGRTKGLRLKATSRVLVERFGGDVPSSEPDLLSLPGVGPKTAHAILVFGFQKAGIPVDTHILRVSKRLGVASPRATILRAQRELALAVPRRYWHLLNPVLIQHGMNLCSPRAPRCGECPIEEWCRKVGVPREPKRAPKG